MATWREMIFMVLDEIKVSSDDSYFTQDHVRFLLSKYRSFLIKQEMEKNKELSDDNYQTLCIELEEVPAIPALPCEGGKYLRSTVKIPDVEAGTNLKVYSEAYFNSDIAYVSRTRFRYVGNNRWLQNIIYATKGPDDKLYLKSGNPQYIYMRNIKVDGIFSDIEEIAPLLCNNDNDEEGSCDVLDTRFPLDEYLIPQCIQLTVKELIGAVYRPKDYKNDAADDLSDIMSFIRRNMKSNLQKQIEDD